MAKHDERRPRRRHHFFLFRHCVRSVSSKIDLKLDSTDYPKDLADYVKSPLPDWQVPKKWCTKKALSLVESTGRWLLQNKIIQGERIQFELIADTSQRDVDTVYSLAEGIKTAAAESKILVSGLDRVWFKHYFSEPIEEGVCEKKYTDEDMFQALSERLLTIPKPNLPLDEALQLLQDIAGTGKAGKLTHLIPFEYGISSNGTDITGAARLLKKFAQALFYSRAGQIDPPFAPKATVLQVYEFIQWIHWSRSIESVDNPAAATHGAVIARAIEQVLTNGYVFDANNDESKKDDDGFDETVTIIAGHDGDLDAIATAMGVQWELKAPYISGTSGVHLATPPMSGIHFVRDLDEDQISLSFVYPVYSQWNESKTWKTNTSGILEYSPLLFQGISPSIVKFERATVIQGSRGETSVQLLRDHIVQRIVDFPGAMECYHATEQLIGKKVYRNHVYYRYSFGLGLLIGTVIGLLIGVLSVCTRSRRSALCNRSGIEYEGVHSADTTELEMVSGRSRSHS